MTIVPRRSSSAVVALIAALLSLGVAHAPASTGVAPAHDLVLRGRGFGHGVGMTHDGALALGRQGRSAAEILRLFYPGTTLGSASLEIRVLVADNDRRTPMSVTMPDGGTIRPAVGPVRGLPIAVGRGARLTVRADGGSVVVTAPGEAPITAPRAVLLIPHSVVSLADGTEHRGLLHVLTAQGRLRAVAHLDVEDYLRGMGEVRDSSWPAASLQAQAIAARTYAIHAARYSPRDPDFDVFADDRSQVYLGAQAEYAAMDRAVRATAGRVLRYDGAVANAVYSTNGGGITAAAIEGFGPSQQRFPYLAPVRYPTADPGAWTVRLTMAETARRLEYAGRLSSVSVSRAGPSGRVLTLRLTGTAGSREISGLDAEDRLGLRSTLFDVVTPGRPRAAAPAPARPATSLALGADTPATTGRSAPGGGRGTATSVAWLLLAGTATSAVGARRREIALRMSAR